MKKILYILLYTSIISSIYGMENGSLENTIKIIKNIHACLPPELTSYILSYVDFKIVIYNNGHGPFLLIAPENRDSDHIELTTKGLALPINLDPCKIVPGKIVSKNGLALRHYFNFVCYYTSSGSKTRFYIDNHSIENRFYTQLSNFRSTGSFLDGLNDNGYILIAANNRTKIKIKKTRQKIKTQKYHYIIGNFTAQGKERFNIKINNPRATERQYQLYSIDDALFKSQPIIGNLTALALSKTHNKFALADNKGISIFGFSEEDASTIKDSTSESFLPRLLGFCNLRKGKIFTKICFVSPSILFGVTKKRGNLYSIVLDEHEGKINLYKQKLKNKEQQVFLQNIAVDPCNTHHILLHTRNNELVYWDLKNHKKPAPGKEFVYLWNNIKRASIWFYQNKIFLGKSCPDYFFPSLQIEAFKFKTYKLYQFDVNDTNEL